MVEEILANIYKIEIPLPGSPLKAVNSYLIRNSRRNLIIDVGMNRKECMDSMSDSLRELGVDMKETDIFITHHHADHLGLASNLVANSSKIYFNQPDADRVKSGTLWDDISKYAQLNGFPEKEIKSTIYMHPGYKYGPKLDLPFTILEENSVIKVGEYCFRCISTPGHTKGHMCLYEPTKRILISGDHILNDITPSIQAWYEEENPLREYLISLDKVNKLNIDIVLPGHRSFLKNSNERIRELKEHHKKRIDEILGILKMGCRNAYQLASVMNWNIACEFFDQFPAFQRLFALGEVIAHLKYLEEKKKILRHTQGSQIEYFLT